MAPSLTRSLLCVAGLASLAAAQCEVQKLSAPSPTESGHFGSFVSADDGTLVVGLNEWQTGGGTGAAVFERAAGTWQLVDQLSLPPLAFPANFLTAVAIDGDTLMLGQTSFLSGAGRVQVYERVAGQWAPTQALLADPALPNAQFGARIAIDGDRAAISARTDPALATHGGAVFAFERVAGVWTQVARLTASPPQNLGFYGWGLALEDDVLAVSEPGGGTSYVYRDGAGGWELEKLLHGPGMYTRSLSLENGILALGGELGAVTLYDESSGWELVDTVTALSAGAPPCFGRTVLLHRDRLIVGTSVPENNNGCDEVYSFRRTSSGWALAQVLALHGQSGGILGQQGFGASLAADGGACFVGASAQNEPLPYSGAVYAYEACIGESYCDATANSTGHAAIAMATGSASVTANDLVLRALPIPPSQPGLFFYGPEATLVPFGLGYLCVSPGATGIARLAPTNSGVEGLLLHELDVTMPPTGATQITAGSTWYFQAWYRDPQDGSFNLSDARSVTFTQ